jgi:prepilin-type N-terminal cleavage/methylation domain-containing protein
MNKKGMTLIELIAVIAIMAILTLMIAPNIIEMRQQSIVTTISSKLTKIHNAAISYAGDNLSSVPNAYTIENLPADEAFGSEKSNKCLTEKTFDTVGETNYSYCEQYCLIVYVKSLIENGYIAGDNEDKTEIINSSDGKSLNNERVCVRYDTDVVEISASERTDRSKLSRKLVAYIIDEEKLYNGLKNTD